jgi:hypothetical protein
VPSHEVRHAHDVSQSIPSLQLPSPLHVTSHAFGPHSTPAEHEPVPVQRTVQARVLGHTTFSEHSPALSQSMMQVPFMHDVHTAGQSVLASISSGSTTHQPSTQSRPGPHCPGFVHSKSSDRVSMLHAGPSTTATTTSANAHASAAIDALTSAPPARARSDRAR